MLGYVKNVAMICAGTPITWASENGRALRKGYLYFEH